MSVSERAYSISAYVAGGFTSLFGVLTWQQWGIAVGIVCTVLTLVVNMRHKRRMEALRKKELEIMERRVCKDG